MDQRPINLLSNREIILDEEPAPKNKLSLRVLIFFALIVLGGSFIVRHYTLARWPNQAEAYDQTTLRPKNGGFLQTIKNFVFQSENIVEGQKNDRINILILGIGGPGHDGPYLSDTNILFSIKPTNKEVALISIPRDLGVKIPGHDWRKINSADAFGEAETPGSGGEYARKVFQDTFGLDIPYYVRVDFKAFAEMINEIGGITINVPRTFTDATFPGTADSYQTVHFDAGIQTMDGERALNYSRSRHGDNGESSDFARSHRQQLVLLALKEKLLSLNTYANPITIQKILSSLSTHVTTNLDFGQIIYLLNIGRQINGSTKTLVLDNSPAGSLVSTTGESGAFILAPKTGNFDNINQSIKNIFDDNSTVAIASDTNAPNPSAATNVTNILYPLARVEIQNGTWRVGLAARTKQKLEEKGFNIMTIGNSLMRPIATTSLYIINPAADKKTVAALVGLLKTKSGAILPDWLTQSYNNPVTADDESGMKYNKDADMLLILGADAKE